MSDYPATKEDVDKILNHIDKAKLSILRGMHSGDKVADILTSLVEVIRETGDAAIWKCPDCGSEASWDSDDAGDGGTPVCGECDIDMVPDRILLYDTQEWKDAEAYVLRITNIRNTKEKTHEFPRVPEEDGGKHCSHHQAGG